MKRIIFTLLLGCIGPLSQAQEANSGKLVPYTASRPITDQPYAYTEGDRLEVRVLRHTDGTYYYEILVNQVVTFRQHDCPGRAQGQGFPTQSSAQKVAERVVMKLKNPVAPPVVTASEMDIYGLK